MKKRIGLYSATIFFTLFVLSSFGTSYAQQVEKRTLQVNGTGEVNVKPDTAFINISVESNAKTAAEASTQNAGKMQGVTDTIKSIIGKDDKITTSGYTLSPVYEYNQTTRRSELKGYRAYNGLNVETRQLDKIGKLIDSTIKSGATNIDSLSFGASGNDDYRRQALVMAVGDARKTAEIVAKASGVKILRILNISPSYSFPIPLHREFNVSAKMAMEAPAAPPTSIESGELTVSANVSIVYEIE